MRPIKKLNIGDQLPSESNLPLEFQERGIGDAIIQASYNPYSNAKDLLEYSIGPYCTYCEDRKTDEAAQIEHIKHKAKFKNIKFKWINFVFACQRCNLTKSDKTIKLKQFHFPLVNNTFLSFEYLDGGVIVVSSKLALNSDPFYRANRTLELVGLHLRPKISGHLPKDKRYHRRKAAWELIKDLKTDYLPVVRFDLTDK